MNKRLYIVVDKYWYANITEKRNFAQTTPTLQ